MSLIGDYTRKIEFFFFRVMSFTFLNFDISSYIPFFAFRVKWGGGKSREFLFKRRSRK